MTFPIAIAIHGIEPSPMLRAEVIEHVEMLKRYLDDILACRVLVEGPACHYGVRVRITLPCFEVEADSRNIAGFGNLDPFLAISETFDVLTRRIEDFVRRRCLSCARYAPGGLPLSASA